MSEMDFVMKATRQSEPPQNPSHVPQGSPGANSQLLAALAGANAFGLAAANPVMFGNTTPRGHAMEMPGRRSTWRSPYDNPDLEYVYLGSPQTSQGSPQTSLPDPVTSFVSNNPHTNVQPPPNNVYQQQGFATAVMAPAPGANYQHSPYLAQGLAAQQTSHRAETHPQGIYGADTQQQFDIWSTLESDLLAHTSVEYNVTPESISMVETFAPPGYNASMPMPGVASNPSGAATPWTMVEEAQSSTSGRGSYSTTTSSTQGFPQPHAIAQNAEPGFHYLPSAGYGNAAVDPRLEFMEMDQISDGVCSTASPGTPFGYGTYGNQGLHGHNQGLHGHNQGLHGHNQGLHGHNQGLHGHNQGFHGNNQGVHGNQGFHGNQGLHANQGFREQQRFAQPENNFREQQMQGNAPMESEFSQPLAPGGSGIRHLGEPRWAEQLLSLCAAAIASKNISRTQHLMWVLNDLASVVGDANQRFAAYGLRALFCRITERMEAAATFLRPRHKEQEVSFGPKTVHRALVKFHEYVPWHQNCYTVTSQTLLEVCAGKSRLHLIDIGAGKGIEWPIFIDALVSRSGGPPSILRMTMIRDLRREELNMHTAKSVNSEAADFMTRLVKFASLLGLYVEVNMVQKPLECVTREDLRLRDGEILAVVCQFRLHRLSEEASAPGRLSPRDEFLAFLYKLEPHVFVHSDNDSDHCSHDFLTRFQSAMGFWWRCFEAIDVGYNGRDPEERQIIEYEGAMMMLNMVACEGLARIERNEAYAQWERRIRHAGFVPRGLGEETRKASENLVHNHSELWDVAFPDPGNVVSLQWRKQPTTFTSVWKVAATSCSKPACKCSMLHS